MQRSIKNADPNGFKHFTEFPGDLHAGAYIEECFAQVHGPTGFYHIAQSVLNQKKVNPASFAKDKLKDGNLQRNKEVGMTVRWAYTISACYEFLKINKLDQKLPLEEFSDQLYTDLITFLKKGKLQKQHHCDVALFGGPFISMFYEAIRNNNGAQREAAWMIAAPLFAQLGKKNYMAEAIAHLVNIVAVWPPAIRNMMRQNCSVSVKGNQGHSIALDEYVETYIVKPLKMYASGHSSITVLSNLCCSLPLLSSVREAYKGTGGFDRHHTAKHSTPTSAPDLFVIINYCVRNKLFIDPTVDSSKVAIVEHDGSLKSTFLPQNRVHAYTKGIQHLKDCFGRRIYELFPERRAMLITEAT